MARPPQEPGYFEARTAINRHLYRHHNTTGFWMLEDRLEQHSELHTIGPRFGVAPDHTHHISAEGESAIEEAFRVLREGEEQDRQGEK